VNTLCWFRNSLECFKISITIIFYLHNWSQVVTSITIVRSTPHSHQIFVFKPELVSLLYQLMSPCNQCQPINVTEIVSYLWSKHPTRTPSIDCPIFDIFRVRPHQIAEWTFMGNFYFSVNCSNLVNGFDFRT
jgi:hypothetical protein